MSLLYSINSPADLKKLEPADLPKLAQEIRDFLISSVSKTGGHIGPSLGVVELTLALHYIFDSPQDKFIWDVGHQSYTHKLLTGRRDQFSTLRQFGGISGFPHITENEHDAMTTGHSSTSISSALGMAQGRDLLGENGEVVAIIGDGAMTGGLAYEGLNNLGHSDTRMVIILNDNEMSIAPNVGGMATYLTRILTDRNYNKLKDRVWNFLDKIPSKFGKPMQNLAHNLDESVKKALTPGKLFEDMGINYLGPIDGHNFEELFNVLNFAKYENKGPLIIHTLTQKGRGFAPAETNASLYHGIGPYSMETGEPIASNSPTPSWSALFGTILADLAERDRSIVALTAAMPSGTGLSGFQKKFPKRLIDVGIAEAHAVTSAAGLCLRGMKPVFAVYSSFLQRAYDQVIHDIALENLDVVFCIDRAGLVGADGPTHHGTFDLSYLSHIPNATILAPSSAKDLKEMLYSAIYEISGPVFIRYPRGNTPDIPTAEEPSAIKTFPPEIVSEEGDLLIISVGTFLPEAIKISEGLKEHGIGTTVVDLKTVKPLCREELKDLFKKHKEILTVEENSLINGAGSSLLALANSFYTEGEIEMTPKFYSFGYPDHFVEQGSISELMKEIGLDHSSIVEKVLRLKNG